MRKRLKTLSLLTFALAMSACQSPPAQPLAVAPVPASLICPPPLEVPALGLKKREPNLTRRLVQTLSPSPTAATTPSATSTSVSTATTPSVAP